MSLSTVARTFGLGSVTANPKGFSQAAALSTSPTVLPSFTPLSLADNIDWAEKGISVCDPVVIQKLDHLQKTSFGKGRCLIPQHEDARAKGRTIGASTTGANPYGEADIAIDGIVELQSAQDMKNRRRASKEVRVSNKASSSTDFPANSNNKTAMKVTEQISSDTKGEKKIVPDNGHSRILKPDYKDYPQGLPRLAAFQNLSSNLAIFRRFGTAHCRLLLHLQVEIMDIINELEKLDISDSDEKGETLYRLRRVEWYPGWDTTQKDLMEKLAAKLSALKADEKVDDLLLKDRALRGLKTAPLQHYKSLFNWIWGCKPLDEGQYNFMFDPEDFVSSPANAGNMFDEIIETSLNKWPRTRIAKLFLERKNKPHTTADEGVHSFSRSMVTAVAKLLSVSVVVTILVAPIFVLYLKPMDEEAMVVMVLMFVLAFATLMSLCTTANIESVFVGTCAYCAVLVTFLGNVQVTNITAGNL
ncbi:hypothetical protein B7463_g3148, partial [Scytalidium lignicola]